MSRYTVEALTFDTIGEGIVHIIWEGEATEVSVEALNDHSRKLIAKRADEGDAILALINAEAATGITRHARRKLRDLGAERPWDRVAFVGVRFDIKVMLELIVRALQAVGVETADTRFFDSDEEALAWLERE